MVTNTNLIVRIRMSISRTRRARAANSADSSVHLCRPNATQCNPMDAYVPVKDVVGKVFALAWPLGRAHIIHTPDAFDDVPAPTG